MAGTIIGGNTQIEGDLNVWTSAKITSAGVVSGASFVEGGTSLSAKYAPYITYTTVNTTSANWNSAYTWGSNGRIGQGTWTGEDSLALSARVPTRLTHFGRIDSTFGSPAYYNFLMLSESSTAKYGTIGFSSDGDWYASSVTTYNANPSNFYTMWTSKNFTSTNISNWNTAFSNTHVHNQTLDTSASPVFSQLNINGGEGTGLTLSSVSLYAPSVSLTNDDQGVYYPFAVKIFNNVDAKTAYRIYADQSNPNTPISNYRGAFEIPTYFSNNAFFDAGLSAVFNGTPVFNKNVMASVQSITAQSDSHNGAPIVYVGSTGWNLPVPSGYINKILLVMGTDATMTTNRLYVPYGCTINCRIGGSYQQKTYGSYIDLIGFRSVELIGQDATTWRVINEIT